AFQSGVPARAAVGRREPRISAEEVGFVAREEEMTSRAECGVGVVVIQDREVELVVRAAECRLGSVEVGVSAGIGINVAVESAYVAALGVGRTGHHKRSGRRAQK